MRRALLGMVTQIPSASLVLYFRLYQSAKSRLDDCLGQWLGAVPATFPIKVETQKVCVCSAMKSGTPFLFERWPKIEPGEKSKKKKSLKPQSLLRFFLRCLSLSCLESRTFKTHLWERDSLHTTQMGVLSVWQYSLSSSPCWSHLPSSLTGFDGVEHELKRSRSSSLATRFCTR